jgi:hypothetical protein
MVDLVPIAAGHPDPISAKVRAEPTGAGGLIVPGIEHEIVLDYVIVPATKIDSVSGERRRVVVANPAHRVAIDGCSRAVGTRIDAMRSGAR